MGCQSPVEFELKHGKDGGSLEARNREGDRAEFELWLSSASHPG